MKKLIDVVIPVVGSIRVTVTAESDDDALAIAIPAVRARVDELCDDGGELFIEVSGNYADLTDVDDADSSREVQIGE